MNKNLQSPTKLTEFAPLQSEEKQQSVGQFITKLFKLNKNLPSPDSNTSCDLQKSYDRGSQESLPAWALETPSNSIQHNSDLDYQVNIIRERSLPNVLKRISNLVALKNTNLQSYSDTDLKQYWMPDSVSKECYECSEKFTTFRRRHHCRVCGQIFCSQCCSRQIPGKIFRCTEDLRVCTYCYKVVLSYLHSPDAGADLKTLQEKLCSASPSTLNLSFATSTGAHSNHLLDAETVLKRKVSIGYQEEKFALGRSESETYLSAEEKCQVLQSSISLRNLYEEMCRPTTGILIQTHNYRLKTYPNSFLGSDLVDWLIYQQKANTRIQASALCQALLEGCYIESLLESYSFVDGYALYKLGLNLNNLLPPPPPLDIPPQNEPTWMQDIESVVEGSVEVLDHFSTSSSYMLDLNVEANTVYLSKPLYSTENLNALNEYDNIANKEIVCEEAPAVKTSEHREFVPESGWHKPSHLREENEEKSVYNILTTAFGNHEENLLKQLLSAYGLSNSWTDIIIPLVHEIVDVIRPDKNHDANDIDIRQYVQFKKVCSGLRSDNKLVKGIVFSKNVAHKSMMHRIDNPKILLLRCPLVYQRIEGRLMSLEPILMQEHEYLRNVVARIVALQPTIVLVQRNVSRLAQDLLRHQGITLVFNVKKTVLDRLARCTQAAIVTSVDAHIGRPKLGTCNSFYLKTFSDGKSSKKTLMFFEGFQMSHLGSTVLLRGSCRLELAKIKSVCSFFLFACYNWRLEKSYLMDIFAQPPNNKDEFFDDSKENSPEIGDSKLQAIEEKSKIGNDNKLNSEVFSNFNDDSKFFNRINKNYADSVDVTAKLFNKKHIEDRKSVSESINDFSDPLLSGKVEDDACEMQNNEILEVAELPFSNYFRKALDDVILCISPYLVFSIPYLETEIGRKCKLRSYFPSDIFHSDQIDNKKKNKFVKNKNESNIEDNSQLNLKPLHPFLTVRIQNNINCSDFQSLLANFRACGGRLEYNPNLHFQVDEEPEEPKLIINKEDCFDALNPLNHQKLAVLICSFCRTSNNEPTFCVKMMVYMKFYGENDIPLGCFLERYCFKADYKCPSQTCDTTMLKHIRRYVHNGGCVSLSLNNADTNFTEEGIFMWSWCKNCQKVSPAVPMSTDTWSFSFAKYLELGFYGGIYTKRGNEGCQHSLHHDHCHYFGYKNLVASFKYSAVPLWEICLPPPIINIYYFDEGQHSKLIDEVKALALKEHEIYSVINDKLHSLSSDVEGLLTLKHILAKDRAIFKQKIDDVQIKLTSPTLEQKVIDFAEYNKVWIIEDAIITIKSTICECVEQWNVRFLEFMKKKDSDKKKERSITVDVENAKLIDDYLVKDNLNDSINSNNSTAMESSYSRKPRSLDQDDGSEVVTSKVHHRSQSDGTVMAQYDETSESRKDNDKKTVKNIFSQLLPSSMSVNTMQQPYSQQEHFTLPVGISFPIVVYENEPSSIVAYSLNSAEYKKCLEELGGKKISSAEPSPSPVHKRKPHSDKDGAENVEVSFSEKGAGILSFLRSKDAINTVQSFTSSDAHTSNQEESPTSNDATDDIKKGKSPHIQITFSDNSTNFCCYIYHAEKFAWLRSMVIPDGEEAYIRSLSRCIHWNAQGGKSGSTFCKSKDDRFILKEIPKSEIQLFFESANNYFLYMQRCFSSDQPTLLGKIVGVYQVIFKNSATNAMLKKYLLVMENLFYNRKVTHKFDLKGSMRNRLVNPDNQEGEIVLLDENLLKMSCDDPLYILPHSKAILTAAIQNDTEFLSEQSVMDYSLLVGLDSDKKELVLGIIDYIRTFTWDKKLETMVKKSGLLGGQGKLPTIVSPKEYKNRFIEAMHRYFLVVPDHWAGLEQGWDCLY